MENLKIQYHELEQAIKLSADVQKGLEDVFTEANSLMSYLQGAAWKGQTKIAFQSYLDIILQYHHTLNEVMVLHQSTIEGLKEKIDTYNNIPGVDDIREI